MLHSGNDLQTNFFQQIEQLTGPGQSASKHIAELLKISTSTAYRKINGETAITLQELALLAQHFHISIDRLIFEHNHHVLFSYPSMTRSTTSPAHFLTEILHMLQHMRRSPSLRVHYATNEIPVFYYLRYPELTALKMYVWASSVWGLQGVKANPAEWMLQLLHDETFQQLRMEVFELFVQTPSSEFYPLNMLDNTLNQVRVLHESELLPAGDFINTLREQLLKLIDYQSICAEIGSKIHIQGGQQGASLDLFYNETMYTNNLILAASDTEAMVLSTLDNPNFLLSTDSRMAQHIQKWFEKLERQSIRLSAGNEKHRSVYFKTLKKRMELHLDL